MRRYEVPGGGWQVCSRFFVLTRGRGELWFRIRVPWPGDPIGRLGPGLKFIDTRTGWVPFSFRSHIQKFALRCGPFAVCSFGSSPA